MNELQRLVIALLLARLDPQTPEWPAERALLAALHSADVEAAHSLAELVEVLMSGRTETTLTAELPDTEARELVVVVESGRSESELVAHLRELLEADDEWKAGGDEGEGRRPPLSLV